MDQSAAIATVQAWLQHTRWSNSELSRAVRAAPNLSYAPPEALLTRWLAGQELMKRDIFRDTMGFIARNPDPGAFEPFIDSVQARFLANMEASQRELQDRRDAVATERAQRRRELLARERQSKPRNCGPMFGFDKATVQALRGF